MIKPKPKTDQAKIQRTANAIRILKEWHDWEEKHPEPQEQGRTPH